MRLRAPEAELPELDHILDLYWGGPERRITTLTTRIIAVNALALIMLMLGIVFLGQYHSNLIEARLESFNTEVELVTASLSEIGIEDGALNQQQAENMALRFSAMLGHHIRIFDENGQLIVDSVPQTSAGALTLKSGKDSLYTVQVLKNMARFIIKLLPQRKTLPEYPHISDLAQAGSYPNVEDALQNKYSISAWDDGKDSIILSGAAPLHKGEQTLGAILITRPAQDITRDIGDVWINVLGAFAITLVITVLLSIYLSGVIASPLRKLARAAEGVRKGKISLQDMPDFRHRKDEIGELSTAFTDMTNALSARMDSIERFAADVAHELKNPLTSLRSAIETASVVKKKKDKDKLMEIVRHDIERLDRLITDISHASRLDAELSRDVFEPISVQSVLNTLFNAYKDPLERKTEDQKSWDNHVQIQSTSVRSYSTFEKDVQVMGHGGRLEQVFQNILSNALSFAPDGSLVEIAVRADGKKIEIIFEDQGPGIPESKIESIFDRFYTQRPDHEAYGKHSGLGLSICKQVISAMGGEIFAENIKEPGGTVKGARFTVRLNKA
ncbi:MAG: sensor N-terminal transmembrane domain-containing protein [Alphaproteobacteria bacterium]|nr:sensor N-terminal transmembrane domain-containing protein [Alphaproteobacteria bacterium]